MQKSRLILWDIDGTLLFCGADGTKALNQTFEKLYGVKAAFEKTHVGHAMDSTHVRTILERFSLPMEDEGRVKQTFALILQEVLDADDRKWVMPGVEPLLRRILESNRAEMALLTSNFRVGAEAKLKSVGLDSFFEEGGFGDEDGEKWDAAQRLIARLEERGIDFDRDKIFLIGDGVYDIETAKRLGFRSVAVGTGWTDGLVLRENEPDYYFEDLTDTEAVLRVLLGD